MKAGRGALVALAATVAAVATWAPVAQAGTYDVYSCKFGPNFYGNKAWTPAVAAAGGNPALFTTDTTCAGPGDVLMAAFQANIAYAPAASAQLQFLPPPSTTITDYTLSLRQLYSVVGQASDPNTAFVMTTFGPYAFTLGGQYDAGVTTYVNQDNHFWGAAGPFDRSVTLSKADSPNSSVKQGTAPSIVLFAGCWQGRTANCTLGASDYVQTQLIGSRVTIQDNVPPAITATQTGTGLLAPGLRAGDEPITFSATDNTGIRRAEIVDVTDAANPSVVASEDYSTGPNTDAGTRCDYTRPRPCPDVKNETISASPPIAGHRTLLLRVTDAAGETTVSAPFTVVARGPLNGVNGGDGARIVAGFPAKVFRGKGKKRRRVFVLRPRHTVSYGKPAKMRGTLKGANGQPIGGAIVRLLARENRLGARYVDRGSVTTGPDGRFQFGIPAGDSRFIRVAYRAYAGDDNFAARSTALLNVRARIWAHGPRHVRRHGAATFRGRLVGHPFPPRGVTLDLQIFQPHVGWRVFGTTRTRKNGRFRVRYHFQPASRGRFTFRLRLRPSDAYPYTRGFSGRMRVRVG